MHAQIFNVLLDSDQLPEALAVVDEVHDLVYFVEVETLPRANEVPLDLIFSCLDLVCCDLLPASLLSLFPLLLVG